jgi:hypothetical protein
MGYGYDLILGRPDPTPEEAARHLLRVARRALEYSRARTPDAAIQTTIDFDLIGAYLWPVIERLPAGDPLRHAAGLTGGALGSLSTALLGKVNSAGGWIEIPRQMLAEAHQDAPGLSTHALVGQATEHLEAGITALAAALGEP